MSAIVLGPDPMLYALFTTGAVMFFMFLGMVEWMSTMVDLTTHEQSERQTLPPSTQLKTFWWMMFWVLLIHGAILAGMIVFYQASEKNPKDNTILLVESIFLGLNLLDFSYKLWVGNYAASPDYLIMLDSKNTEVVSKRLTGEEERVEGNVNKSLVKYRMALYILNGLGLIGYLIGTASYLWVGSIESYSSNSRSMVLSGALVISVFLIVTEALKNHKIKVSAALVTDMIGSIGVKLPYIAKNKTEHSNLDTMVTHQPIHIESLHNPLTDSNPITPLAILAQSVAAKNPKPGINAKEFCVRQSNGENYLLSPLATSKLDKYSNCNTGDLLYNHIGWLGTYQNKIARVDGVFPADTEKESDDLAKIINNTPMFGKYNTDFVPYTGMYNKVCGFGVGFGIWIGFHNWTNILVSLYTFALYLVLLKNGEASLLAWTATTLPSLTFSMMGRSGQFWELFRWNQLIGWSIINLIPNIMSNGQSYVRQADSWNNITCQVQTEPSLTNVDLSLTILGFSALQITYSCLLLLVVLVALIVERSQYSDKNHSAQDMKAKSTMETKPLINTGTNLKTLSVSDSLTKRRTSVTNVQ